MIHVGDITKLKGYELLPVDIVIGGSPCQNLSRAGNRLGLKGSESKLFLEQIRIIKEMHQIYGTKKPRYMVWENVPGAFSSNRGEDFQYVLQETAKIIQSDAIIPRPPKGKWKKSGAVLGDRWSIAWRVFDAQFWGVPQRRKRIALIADFRGQSAPEILFIRKSLSGDTQQKQTERKDAAGGIGTSIKLLYENHGADSRYTGPLDICPTITSRYGTGGNNVPLIVRFKSFGEYSMETVGKSLLACDDITTSDLVLKNGTVRRLTPLECERLQGFPDGWTNIGEWTDSKGKKRKSSDSVRYKALGNSIALPPWKWVLEHICKRHKGIPTLGSLFDGIGGFPYLWEQINGKGSVVWASEIDEFCIAVTKKRINNEF